MLARQETVVADVVMGEHDSFGETGRARSVLHVHRVVAVHLRFCFQQLVIVYVASQKQNLGGVVHTPVFFGADVNHVLHAGETFALQISALAGL